MLKAKYKIAFEALAHIAHNKPGNTEEIARDAMQACIDLGDTSDTPDPLRSALESARSELERQRTIWTGSKDDSWALACISTEIERINKALLSLPKKRSSK